MGHVDFSDQCRNYYWMDHWLRKQKWWWAIYLWGMGVMIVNVYTCYHDFHVAQGTKTKNTLSQYDFRHSLSLAWMKHEEYWKTKRSGKRTLYFATEEVRKINNRAYTRSENKPVRAPSLSTSSLDVTTGKQARTGLLSLRVYA